MFCVCFISLYLILRDSRYSTKMAFGLKASPLHVLLPFVQLVGLILGPLYSSVQDDLFLRLRTCSAALVAISKTSRTPSLVLAEHSRYPKALIRPAMSRPSSILTGSYGVK